MQIPKNPADDKELETKTESLTTEESKEKQVPEKVEETTKGKETEGDFISIKKSDYEALKNGQSNKDKEINEIKKSTEETQKQLQRLQEENQLKDKLLTTEMPVAIRNKMQSKISSLTLENFDSTLQDYLDLMEETKKEFKTTAQRSMTGDPDPQEIKTQTEQIKNAKSIEEIQRLQRESRQGK